MTQRHAALSIAPSGVAASMGVLPACTPINPTSTVVMLRTMYPENEVSRERSILRTKYFLSAQARSVKHNERTPRTLAHRSRSNSQTRPVYTDGEVVRSRLRSRLSISPACSRATSELAYHALAAPRTAEVDSSKSEK